MRYGHIDSQSTFHDLLADPLFAEAFLWLQEQRSPTPRAEPYPIIGNEVSARVIQYTPQPLDHGVLETHHDYVDLQVCVGPNSEKIVVADAAELTIKEDSIERDVTFYNPPRRELEAVFLSPGNFAIFDTEKDAHMPQRIVNPEAAPGDQLTGQNLKIVIKIRKSALNANLKL